MEREVTLAEVLEARENRVWHQNALLEKYGVPVISFTLNIAGPVKDSPLIVPGGAGTAGGQPTGSEAPCIGSSGAAGSHRL